MAPVNASPGHVWRAPRGLWHLWRRSSSLMARRTLTIIFVPRDAQSVAAHIFIVCTLPTWCSLADRVHAVDNDAHALCIASIALWWIFRAVRIAFWLIHWHRQRWHWNFCRRAKVFALGRWFEVKCGPLAVQSRMTIRESQLLFRILSGRVDLLSKKDERTVCQNILHAYNFEISVNNAQKNFPNFNFEVFSTPI
jgi:hypothetical protein